MGKDIRHEYDGRKLIKYCEQHGAEVRHGKGDHVVVKKNAYQEVIPARNLGHGLQSKIIKWMCRVGIIVAVLAIVMMIF